MKQESKAARRSCLLNRRRSRRGREARIGVIVEGSGAHAGKVLVRQRPATGLLAQMWGAAAFACAEGAGIAASFQRGATDGASTLGGLLTEAVVGDTGLLIRPHRRLMDADHIFSHIHWKMRVYMADLGAMKMGAVVPMAQMAAEAAAVYTAAGKQLEEQVDTEQGEPLKQQEELTEPYRWIGPEHMDDAGISEFIFENIT